MLALHPSPNLLNRNPDLSPPKTLRQPLRLRGLRRPFHDPLAGSIRSCRSMDEPRDFKGERWEEGRQGQ